MTPLEFFLEIAAIPRCSKHEEKIREYLISFAKSRGLKYKVDSVGNLVIYKGNGRNPIVLQAHMDMVCEKDPNIEHDFSKDPIEVVISNGKISAKGTTLGADDGLGIAIILSILDSSIDLPPIEALFTVDEETGLTGASNLEKKMINGRMLINLDSEDFGIITIGCSGGVNSKIVLGAKAEKGEFKGYKVVVSGLKGGHSGVNIHEQRGNAIKIVARLLYSLRSKIRISSIKGGDKTNSIPRSCTATFVASKRNVEGLIKERFEDVKKELSYVDPELNLSIEKVSIDKVFDNDSSKKIVDLLMALPNGVLRMSDKVKGLVETSANLAKIRSKKSGFVVEISSRSSIESRLDYVLHIIESVSELVGAKVKHYGRYPGWEPNPDSVLLDLSKSVFKRLFGRYPKVEAIHAGLETGIIGKRFEGMDIISIGPTVKYPHTPREYAIVDTIDKTFNYVVELLKEIKDLN